MYEFPIRLVRAAGFGGTALLGLHLAGTGPSAAFAVALAITLFFVLNVRTGAAGTIAAMLVAWGCLVAAGLLPSVQTLWKLANVAHEEASKLDLPLVNEVSTRYETLTVSQELAEIKQACDKGLMTRAECDAARAKILAKITK